MSPSPSKRRRLSDGNASSQFDSDQDEDEETIKLKLKAIEARLKLKKLQKAKQKVNGSDNGPGLSSKRKLEDDADIPAGASHVEVPHSPKPQRANIPPPKSPRRIQLGIDKGLRANQVSLKRARPGVNASATAFESSSDRTGTNHRSFGARLAESRSQDVLKRERQERIKTNRSEGFGVSRVASTRDRQRARGGAAEKLQDNAAPNNAGSHWLSPSKKLFRRPGEASTNGIDSVGNQRSNESSPTRPAAERDDESEPVEKFSGFKLSKQKIDDSSLETALASKTLISIPKLLKTVVGPDFDPPDIEDDYVVLGIIASKSLPQKHATKHHSKSDADPNVENVLPPRSKFMAIRLTDLKWEVDLYLFDTAFDRFWKLTVGTVIAILNPGIMPPKPHMRDTGRFSLKIASSEDTVLEIGMSKDLGFCKSIKKDGKQCSQWIDGRKSDYCDFHVNLRVEKAKAARMEINGMANFSLFGDNAKSIGQGGGRGGQGRGRGQSSSGRGRGDGLKREGAYFDRSVGETTYVIPKEFSRGINTSEMLDAEDYVQDGLSKAEKSRRRLAAHEKERNLAKALGAEGSGLGSEYMRLKQGDKDSRGKDIDKDRAEEPTDAASLGLVGSNAHSVKLSPLKKLGRASRTANTEPMGWSGALKRGLLSPSRKENRAEPLNGPALAQKDKTLEKKPSPSKQARFFLKEKGIRTPGRESAGNVVRNAAFEDEDDLDIV